MNYGNKHSRRFFG